jgi:hypothetical protein
MNFEQQFSRIESGIKSLVSELSILKNQHEDAKTFTAEFLKSCENNGIKTVSISRNHETIKSTQGWPFGHSGSVFADKEDAMGLPAIWRVVEKLGINGGCGNTGQHSADCSRLIDGVYQFKNGKWDRLEK